MIPKATKATDTRDDFMDKTKIALGSRVGYLCSNPNCQGATVGPSEDRVTGIARTGDAAHITAASPGGPRYDAELTSSQRADSANGIWLCKPHASLVDSNHSRYSVGLLHAWKNRAEDLARIKQGGVGNSNTTTLFAHEQRLATDDNERAAKAQITDWLSDFFDDVGAKQVFTHADRLVAENALFEMILNAHRHEGVRQFQITSQPNTISVGYTSSTQYGLVDLMAESSGRGGVDAVEMLEDETQGRVILNFQSIDQISRWICSVVKLGYSDDPCAINLHGKDELQLQIFKTACEGCAQVHVHGHLNDHSSDNWVTARYVEELIDEGHHVVVHSKPGPLAKHLRRTIEEVLKGRGDFELSEHA
ncbi:hypothetical protein [Arthrobacter sp. efr-133-TYG-120]|uniref:hypothetical protein n=1 Tax=Arthrobacter sp. efr-133-TYG-120 TaxID=3040280 RepID=UPI00254B765E|nr:hypothetical protein [Arthrobacter sp. efr-133-TYG-120]